MNRAMIRQLAEHTRVLIIMEKIMCDVNMNHHGELHLTIKIKIINR